MRMRFSLRTLLIFTTAFAGFCYYWVIMPGATAERFVHSIGTEDYRAADRQFWHASDRVLDQWKEKYWGFQSEAEVLPWSPAQFLSGRRNVRLHVTYFFLDERHDLEMQVAATAFGIQPPGTSFANNSMMIDRSQEISRREFQR